MKKSRPLCRQCHERPIHAVFKCRRCYNRARSAAHKAERHEYYIRNRERCAQQARARYAKNRERILAQCRDYRASKRAAQSAAANQHGAELVKVPVKGWGARV